MPRPTHATVTPWTAKETATALRLYASGHTFTDIAQTLRRSRGEIAGKIFRERRKGKVTGRFAPEPPPPAAKDKRVRSSRQKPRRPKVTQQQPSDPPAPPIPMPPPVPSPPPKPVGPPTCWELGLNDCRFPIGRREPEGHATFCAQEVEPGTSWCPDHHRVVYTRRAA